MNRRIPHPYPSNNPQIYNRDPRSPDVRFDGSRLIGLADLHQQRMRTRRQRRVCDPLECKYLGWYNDVLQEELYDAPVGYKLQVFHWSIESGVDAAFRSSQTGGGECGIVTPGPLFDAVSMIVGPTMEYSFGVCKHPLHGGTASGRLLRCGPPNPCDQFRLVLPRCDRVLAACNSCSWLFRRGCRGRNDRPAVPATTISSASSSTDDDDNDDEYSDGGTEDVLFFRISMLKFRRTSATTYNPVTGRRIRMNVRRVRPNLSTISESAPSVA